MAVLAPAIRWRPRGNELAASLVVSGERAVQPSHGKPRCPWRRSGSPWLAFPSFRHKDSEVEFEFGLRPLVWSHSSTCPLKMLHAQHGAPRGP